LHNHLGELIHVQPYPQQINGSYAYNGNRGEIYAVLVERARELGVEIRFGCNVQDYWEDKEMGKAGVFLQNGDRLEADLVVGADGVRSRARKLILVGICFYC
jgi:2-polyprenyl-6-methoxyphenol hydroxylase-like FAD-dependent oxidoreductase